MKHLVLFTNSYPYGTGEAFLEDEVPILAAHFSEVSIVCDDDSGAARKLPPNCRVLARQACLSWRSSFRLFWWIWLTVRLLCTDMRCITRPHISYVVRSAIYRVRQARVVVATAEQYLHDLTAESCEFAGFCFYSYWLDHKALAADILARRFPGSVAVSRAHGYDLYAYRQPHHYLPFQGYLVSNLCRVFPVSDDGTQHLREQFPAAQNIETARLGVNQILNSLPQAEDAVTELTVLSVSSLIPLKRVALLIQALALLPSLRIVWHHFGDGPMGGNLEELAKAKLKIPFNFEGQIDNKSLRKALAQSSGHAILVNTSEYEGIPVSMMEAMACGIPCIGTNVGGVGEIINSGSNGFLLSSDPCPEEIAVVIQRYAELPKKERLLMGLLAHSTWSEKFHAEANYQDFATQLNAL